MRRSWRSKRWLKVEGSPFGYVFGVESSGKPLPFDWQGFDVGCRVSICRDGVAFDIGAWQKSHGLRISYTFWIRAHVNRTALRWWAKRLHCCCPVNCDRNWIEGTQYGRNMRIAFCIFPGSEWKACLDLFSIVRRLALMAEARPTAAAFPPGLGVAGSARILFGKLKPFSIIEFSHSPGTFTYLSPKNGLW